MMYSIAGLVLALGVAAAAWRHSRRAGGFYDAQIYGMDRAMHRRYCTISLGFAAFFALAYALHLYGAGIGALTLYVLVAVFYASSFLRGAADADE
jgi:hypothetical protein